MMIDTFPGEVVAAWEAMAPYGNQYLDVVRRGVERLKGKNPELAAEVEAAMGLA
ncbi:hypothetical protein [Endothiovibrio diazotrophicus]